MLRSENDSLAKYENAFRASNEQVKSLRREITNLNQRRQAADSAKSDIDQIASAARLINPGSDDTSPQILGGNTRGLPASRPASAPREHIVVHGDSLSQISLRYYGTSNRWQYIYEANRDVLSRENVLRPG